MNCLSYRALLRAVACVGVALVLILVASGAYAGIQVPRTDDATGLVTDAGPSIVFTGSGIAPLVCTSTPDTSAVTITDDTRITLANFTGAEASVDTGTAQELTVADGTGLSVRFRPGQYAVRMVPSCTLTSTIAAAVVTVLGAGTVDPKPTPRASENTMPPGGATSPPALLPTPSGPAGPRPTGEVQPSVRPSHTGGGTDAGAPSGGVGGGIGGGQVTHGPVGGGQTGGGRGGTGGGSTAGGGTAEGGTGGSGAGGGKTAGGGSTGTGQPVAASAAVPAPTGGPGDVPPASGAEPGEPAIYDVLMVQVPQPGDPRDARLLAAIAIICVFGVTTAIIRAILSQRARGMVST